MKTLMILTALISLSSCSIFESDGDEIVFDTTLGPRTEAQIKSLPSTLEGDTGNARYSNEPLKGKGMESEGGTG